MRQLGIFFRTFALLLGVTAVPAAVGFAWGGVRGAVGAAGFAAFAGLLTGLTSERWVARAHGAIPAAAGAGVPPGLGRSLERVLSERGERTGPALYVFNDPSPNMVVARSLFRRRGAIFLSRGLIPLLSEAELRAVLSHGIDRSGQAGLCLRSLCAVLAAGLIRICPADWVRSTVSGNRGGEGGGEGLTPFALLCFLFVYPLVRILVSLGGYPETETVGGRSAEFDDATRKVRQAIRQWGMGELANPGFVTLYFEYPWPAGHVLSLSPKAGLR